MKPDQANSGVTTPAEPNYLRCDIYRRDIVDRAISVQESRSTMSALEFLKSHGIDPRVIERVLLEPQRRRPHIY